MPAAPHTADFFAVSPQPVLHHVDYVFVFCLVFCPSIFPPRAEYYLFRFARILNGFRKKNAGGIINTANRLNNYILGEIGIEARDARKFESTSAGV